jgi:cell division protein FtsQ
MAMKRSFLFWVYFVVAIILGIYFTTRIVMISMGHGQLATIHNIAITADASDSDLSGVKSTAAAGLGAPTGSLDLDILNNRIMSVPIVRNAATRRLSNGTLRIRVELHRAVAQWTDGVAFYPLAADGTTVETPVATRNADAIVFRGTLPDDISEITTTAQPLAQKIDYLEWIENRRWNIITTDGVTVMLPESNPLASLRELISLNEKQNILERDIKILDMRDSARILVK